MDFIEKNGFIKNSDYSKLTKRSKAMRVLDLDRLIDMGLIERKARGRATHYILKEKIG